MNEIKAQVNISYDYDSSYVNFQDNLEKFGDKWVYVDHGNISVPEIYELINIHGNNKKDPMLECLNREFLSRDECIDDLYSTFKDVSELESELNAYGIKYTKYYEEISTRGYSQGDYAEVIIPTIALEKALGCKKFKVDKEFKEYIGNLFWDAPVDLSINLDLNGTEVEIRNYDMDIPEYWNYPYGIEESKKQSLEYIREKYKNVAAVEKIVQAVSDAFPSEITIS